MHYSRKLRISYQPGYHRRPSLRLQGLWFLEAGYRVGDQIEVVILPEFLVIAKEGEHPITTSESAAWLTGDDHSCN